MRPDAPVLLLTRPLDAAQEFAAKLGDGGTVVFSPLIEIELLADIPVFETAIFSSRNGVAAAGSGNGRMAYCVGSRTAKAASESGYNVQFYAQNAASLVQKLVSNPPKTTVTHLRGKVSRGEINKNLTAAGILSEEYTVYRQNPIPISQEACDLLMSPLKVVLPMFSQRTATLLMLALDDRNISLTSSNLTVIALSKEVAQPLLSIWRDNFTISPEPTGDMMLHIVKQFFSD